MKTNKLILIAACVFFLNMPIRAQFNTIGTVNSKHIETVNPSKPNETLTDSTEVPHSEPMASENGNRQIADVSSDDRGKESLVSLPLKNIHINSGFGMRMHPIYHRRIMHNGVDLHARHEDVLSMLPGRVIRVGYDSRSGKFVTVQSANYTVSYCHLSQQYVRQNDYVYAGQPIGLTGSTGAATGEHLHLTTKKDGKAFNPVILLELVRKIVETT